MAMVTERFIKREFTSTFLCNCSSKLNKKRLLSPVHSVEGVVRGGYSSILIRRGSSLAAYAAKIHDYWYNQSRVGTLIYGNGDNSALVGLNKNHHLYVLQQ